MAQLNAYFTIEVSSDHMIAELQYTDNFLAETNVTITSELITQFLTDNHINYGFQNDMIEKLLSGPTASDFPMIIARGKAPVPGNDGTIQYEITIDPVIEKTDSWNFRDVMQIPSVEKDELIATIIQPTSGTDGVNVYGKVVSAKPGKPVNIKAGQNVRYEADNQAFYAESVGQASASGNMIHVHPVFEVMDSLSMKEGNIDFIGTVIIHGDVPSGYTIKAGGDIKIFGLVEAATVLAEGSIYITEGLSGLQKGIIEAAGNVRIGYINQGTVKAGNQLFVENSILHSECIAGNDVICQKGSIIGGRISAGVQLYVRNIGNQLNTKTELILGRNHHDTEHLQKLVAEKKEIEDTLAKLTIIGEKLTQTPNIEANPKLFQALQRQRASYDKNTSLLEGINKQLELKGVVTREKMAKLIVTGNIFANTLVSFGKYKRVVTTPYKHVEFELVHNEIVMNTQ